MMQLKEMLVKESSEEKVNTAQRKTITSPPKKSSHWRLNHQSSVSISGPLSMQQPKQRSTEQKFISLSEEDCRTPRVKTMKRDESLKVERDSLLENQDSYEFHSSSEEDIIVQLNKEKKQVTREDIARLLKEKKRKKEERKTK